MIDTRTIYEIRDELRRNAELQDSLGPITRGHQGAIVGYLNKYMLSDLRRQLALYWLFDASEEDNYVAPKSTKLLSNGEWRALSGWIDAVHEPDIDEWVINPSFQQEAKTVSDYAEVVYYATNAVAHDDLFDDAKIDLPDTVREALLRGATLKQISDELPTVPRPATRFARYKK